MSFATSSATEREALLQRHHQRHAHASRGGSAARNGRRPTSSSSQLSATHEDVTSVGEEDARSEATSEALSHVLLDTSPTYVRLVCAHVMALLPCIALLLASVMLAWHAPCHIHQSPVYDRKEERQMCSTLLNDRVSLAAFGLGIVCWMAAFAVRPALWKVIELGTRLALMADLTSSSPSTNLTSSAATISFVLLKTSTLEFLRLFSVLLANALIFAGLLKVPHLGTDDRTKDPHARWTLHWFDPRFTVAVWVAVGWALAEFVVSSWQLFDRLSLYEVDFDETIKHGLGPESGTEEANIGSQDAQASDKPTVDETNNRLHIHSDSERSGEYSDSNATVRARSGIHIPGIPGPEASDGAIGGGSVQLGNGGHHHANEAHFETSTLTPSARLLDARRRVLAAAEESGISIPYSDVADDEAEELGALRQTLDMEMDTLVKARTRVELEASFGQPLTSVPIVLCTLWRIDGWLWNLGSTLLMAASVTWAQGPLTGHGLPPLFPAVHTNATTLLVLIALHTFFTTMWTLALPQIGFASVTYASMLAGMALCIAASARWGLLV